MVGSLFLEIAVTLLLIGLGISYLWTLYKALSLCSPDSRTLSPGMVWLLLIPLFNIVWQFIVVSRLSSSLHNEFEKRGMHEHPAPGRSIGIATCILFIFGASPPGLVCWIVYWFKIDRYSNKLRYADELTAGSTAACPTCGATYNTAQYSQDASQWFCSECHAELPRTASGK